MVAIYKNGKFSVEFEVVFAYLTPDNIAQETGIVCNFSVKQHIRNEKGIVLTSLCLNDLNIRQTRNNALVIGSQHRDTPRGPVYATTFFPGSSSSDDAVKEYDQFIDSLLKEIEQFVQRMRAEKEQKVNRVLDKRLNNLRQLVLPENTTEDKKQPF